MSDWKKVESSNIAKVRYVDGDMEVQFTKGAVYRYKEVPKEVFEDLLKAESVGKFFFAKIKGKFECAAVEEKGREKQWSEKEVNTLQELKRPPLEINKVSKGE